MGTFAEMKTEQNKGKNGTKEEGKKIRKKGKKRRKKSNRLNL